ncbi:MAG: bi-domain-containing oxidoreductase [Elusimicrobia bacterium]|nr:bi-domain-containing oxidoreductase [Elusimicrobiota bacterium]
MKQLLQNLKSGETYLAEVPVPQARDGQVLVRLRASAVSAGTERMLVDFAKSTLLGKARKRPDLVRQAVQKARRDGILSVWDATQGRLDQPLPLGYSAAGVVEAVGEGVDGFSPGDFVACAGAGYANHAEFAAVPQNLCVKFPQLLTNFEDAAFSTLGAIALQGFRLSEARLGESVVVIGLGVLGQLAGLIAKAAGCRVLGIDLDARRLEVAKAGGFDAAVTRAGAEAAAMSFTDGRGFDVVLICADAASSDPIELSGALARDRGVVVAIGNVNLAVPRTVFYRKELALHVSRSYGPGRYDPSYEEGGIDYPYAYVRWTEKRNIEEFLRLLSTGSVRVAPLITHRLPFGSAVEAYRLIASSGDEPSLGVVLTYGEFPSAAATQVWSPAPRRSAVGGVGVIGAGQFASSVLLPIVHASGASLRGIASASGTKAKAAADRFGFAFASSRAEEVIADADTSIVAVLTRHCEHAAQACAALAVGKSVFVEKPLCLTLDEFRRVEAAARSAKGILAVGFNRRFAPFSIALKKALPDGAKAIQIRINAGALPAGHWVLEPSEGGRLLGEGCHFIDWANFVVGSKPSAADARGIGSLAGDQDWSLRLSYSDGSVADILYVSTGDSAAGKERYEVHSGGVSAVLEDFRRLTIWSHGRKASRRAWMRADKGHQAQWSAFAAAVRQGRPAPVSLDDVLASSHAALAAHESLHSGKPVSL